MNLPLFDSNPTASMPLAGDEARREAQGLVVSEPRRADVLHRFRHKAGTFYFLRPMTDDERKNSRTPASALVVGEFSIVELYDGRLFREFTDGRREPAPPSIFRSLIDEAVRRGEYVEVSA